MNCCPMAVVIPGGTGLMVHCYTDRLEQSVQPQARLRSVLDPGSQRQTLVGTVLD
jgi:hypothetical protein